MSKNVWMLSAVLVVALSVFLGVFISNNALLTVLGEPVETEQVIVSESPWTQEGSLFTTQVVYISPAGEETNTITIEVAEDTVTSFDMSIDTPNEVSKMYQQKFITELQAVIVGKKVSEIAQIDTIAGASLTTDAFKNAAAQL